MRTARRHLAVLGIAALAVPVTATGAVPSTPALDPVPPVVAPGSALGWAPAAFDAAHTSRGYRVALTSPTAPPLTAGPPDPLATALPLPALVDGATYQATVSATALEGGTPVASPASAPAAFLYDARPPAGTVRIDDGAAYATGLTVTLHFDAADPLPGSGTVGAMDVVEGGFPCGDPIACHRSYVTGVQKYLSAGPDGIRTISARFYDTAARIPAGPGVVDGNVSEIVSDTIFLDRRPPTARIAASATSAPPGRTVTFSSAGSADGAEGPSDSGLSGVVEWDFGDGTTATGATASHAFAAGTHVVTLRVRDRAGLAGTATTTIRVGAGGSAAAAPRVTGLRVLGAPRAGAPLRVRLTLRGRAPVTVRLLRMPPGGGAGAPVRAVRRTAGPGAVLVVLRAPAAGRYRLQARVGARTVSMPLRIPPGG